MRGLRIATVRRVATLTNVQPRWEGDERGQGVADASRLVGGLEELATLATKPNWVAESPDVQLLPHIREACAASDACFELIGSDVAGDGTLIVHLRERRPTEGVGALRAAVYRLLGLVAEISTYVRQRRDPAEFEIITGLPPGDGPFATHGHSVILRIQR